MRRKEAEKLVGERVAAWTAANGRYVGTLKDVHGSPWRGTVLITGVISAAVVYEFGRTPRRGFRPGEEIEVGGSSISPMTAEGTSYLEALRAELRKFEEWAARPNINPKDARWVPWAVERLREAVRREEADQRKDAE